MSFLPSSDPEFFVPPELLLHIFSFCPPSSLAVVARTTLACLQLASPFLRLEGANALPTFFGKPVDEEEDRVKPALSSSKQPDLLGFFKTPPSPLPDRTSPFLSLSQTQHLAFLAVGYFDVLSSLSRRRLPSDVPLPLKTLTVSLPPQPELTAGAGSNRRPILIFHLVSPKHFTFLGRSPPNRRFHRARRAVPDLPFVDISHFPWTHLESVVLTNSQINYARTSDPVPGQTGESILPRTFELVLNLADAWIGWEDRLGEDLVRFINQREDEGRVVVVLVESEEKKLEFEAMEKRKRERFADGVVDAKTR